MTVLMTRGLIGDTMTLPPHREMTCHIHTDRKMFLILNGVPMCLDCFCEKRGITKKKKKQYVVIGIKESRKIEGEV